MAEAKVYEMTEEEWQAEKEGMIAELKAIPGWQQKLTPCHIKCSDFDHHLAVWLWMTLSKEEIAELYREAGVVPD